MAAHNPEEKCSMCDSLSIVPDLLKQEKICKAREALMTVLYIKEELLPFSFRLCESCLERYEKGKIKQRFKDERFWMSEKRLWLAGLKKKYGPNMIEMIDGSAIHNTVFPGRTKLRSKKLMDWIEPVLLHSNPYISPNIQSEVSGSDSNQWKPVILSTYSLRDVPQEENKISKDADAKSSSTCLSEGAALKSLSQIVGGSDVHVPSFAANNSSVVEVQKRPRGRPRRKEASPGPAILNRMDLHVERPAITPHTVNLSILTQEMYLTIKRSSKKVKMDASAGPNKYQSEQYQCVVDANINLRTLRSGKVYEIVPYKPLTPKKPKVKKKRADFDHMGTQQEVSIIPKKFRQMVKKNLISKPNPQTRLTKPVLEEHWHLFSKELDSSKARPAAKILNSPP